MTRVAIVGSCVTRDAFGPQDADRWQISTYYARTSLASAFGAVPFDDVDLEGIESAFQRRMVEQDLRKSLPVLLATDDSELVVYDPVDERFDLLEHPTSGALCTWSAELSRVTTPPAGRRIRSGSDEFFRLWEAGWERLLRVLDARGRRADLRVNAARWASEVDDGGPLPAIYSDERIAAANAFLARLYARMRQDLSEHQFVEPRSRDLVAAREHRWGASPFHLVPSFYDHFRAGLAQVAPSDGPAHGHQWAFDGPGDRHVVDIPTTAHGDQLEIEVCLVGWASLRYVAVGTVSRGVYHRMMFSAVEQDEVLRLAVPRELLTDVRGQTAEGAPVEAIRFYVSGVPGLAGAALVVGAARVARADRHADGGMLHVAGWHPRYQLPIAEPTPVEGFAPARGVVALYPVDDGEVRVWTMAGVRRSSRLAVGFHGAVDRASTEYPYFERVTSQKEAAWSFLLVSDATLVRDPDLGLGWFLGSADDDLLDVVHALTSRMRDASSASALAVTGGSGGGFAALQLAARIPQSIAVAFAPQTILWRYNRAAWERAARTVFGCDEPQSDPRVRERVDVTRRYELGTSNLVDLVINQGDTHHVQEHCQPFAAVFGLSTTGGTSADGRVRVVPVDLGEGHVPVSRDLFETSLVSAFDRVEQREAPDLSPAAAPGETAR
ncbi:DUF6270 domain-containing protein [Cellulomonas triticagri]|uniref:Uncharacterized protein n=1 Tax=Cellulomonas triticagri TaxID=2483352 RepID=A0A3M2JPF3_9CELL|nr:DUF6270 domain-containing protein [Cellulomonas triticagri]RMI12585.1 hypothetical protein EBM89_08090 [Cellulomonas triticagri]